MIAIFTDFGHQGPYVGQMEAVLAHMAPGVPAVRLISDAPRFDARASAYLLAALVSPFPAGTVFLCVVDPGVGSARRALMLRADGRWYVGPDNGLLAIVARHAAAAEWREILWRPHDLSASFHGRDLFAPVAAMLATGGMPESVPCEPAAGHDWPDDLAEVVYVDHYGNLFTGMRAARMPAGAGIGIAGRRPVRARTFSDVKPGGLMWYANAHGLVEIAANQGDAAGMLGVGVGAELSVTAPE
ncbi:MAG TPA: SAM-dependent chlorinase/fluorinase [Mariprofundaceae bacterium]|nr:SAM-dependent chlorinase/fluorinase [Mariprofundaceae bacterium]